MISAFHFFKKCPAWGSFITPLPQTFLQQGVLSENQTTCSLSLSARGQRNTSSARIAGTFSLPWSRVGHLNISRKYLSRDNGQQFGIRLKDYANIAGQHKKFLKVRLLAGQFLDLLFRDAWRVDLREKGCWYDDLLLCLLTNGQLVATTAVEIHFNNNGHLRVFFLMLGFKFSGKLDAANHLKNIWVEQIHPNGHSVSILLCFKLVVLNVTILFEKRV